MSCVASFSGDFAVRDGWQEKHSETPFGLTCLSNLKSVIYRILNGKIPIKMRGKDKTKEHCWRDVLGLVRME